MAALVVVATCLAGCNNTVGTSTQRQTARIQALAKDPAFEADVTGFVAGVVVVTPGTSGGTWNHGGSVVQFWEQVDLEISVEVAAAELVQQMESDSWTRVALDCAIQLVVMTKPIESDVGTYTASASVRPDDTKIVLTAEDFAQPVDPALMTDCA